MKFLGILFLALGIQLSGVAHADPLRHGDWSFYSLGLTPVQSGGRIKPLETFAREIVLYETGSRSFKGWNSLDLLLSWIAHPQAWEKEPLIQVGREDVRRQLGLEDHRTFYSPWELIHNSTLAQYANEIGKGVQGTQPPGAPKSSPREQELKAVLNRLGTFHGLITGQNWLMIPKAAPAAWGSLVDTDHAGDVIRNQFVDLLKAYQGDDQAHFERASGLFRAAVEGEIPSYQETVRNQVIAESIYQRVRPFLAAWIFYLLASVTWTVSHWVTSPRAQRRVNQGAGLFTAVALSSHIMGMGLRCYIAGRPPVTNMYESVIWVSFGVMVFSLILYQLHRQQFILAVSCALALLGLIAGDAAPAILDPSINPLVPVLRSNYWLTIHVLTITSGYAAFALALGLANVTLFQFLKKAKAQKIASLNQVTYRAIQFGVVFIAAGTILGGIWADYSWGRFWGWDPKEVWALITLLAYLMILHGRYANWVSPFGFAAWSAVSFMTVIMAWYGVNFILGVGLHSYGFASGGTPWVAGFVGLQLLYVLGVAAVHKRDRRRGALQARTA